jgi:SET domain.
VNSFKKKCTLHYFSIDATLTDCLAKFINDSPDDYANSSMKKVFLDGQPMLVLKAKRDIEVHEEIRYNYGDKENKMFWRENVSFFYYIYIYPKMFI